MVITAAPGYAMVWQGWHCPGLDLLDELGCRGDGLLKRLHACTEPGVDVLMPPGIGIAMVGMC